MKIVVMERKLTIKKDWRHSKAMIKCLKQFASTQLLLLHLIISFIFCHCCYCANFELQINGISTRKNMALSSLSLDFHQLQMRCYPEKKVSGQCNKLFLIFNSFFCVLFFFCCLHNHLSLIIFLFNKCFFIYLIASRH